jgi:hypothetical protein
MDKKEKKASLFLLILKRAFEVIAVEILLASAATGLYYVGFYSSRSRVFLVSLLVAVIYFGWTAFNLFQFRDNVRGKGVYFLVNLPLYAVLFAGAILSGNFLPNTVYAFLFMPFKLLHYAALSWSFRGAGHLTIPVSAALMSAVFALPLFVVPMILSTKRKRMIRGLPPKLSNTTMIAPNPLIDNTNAEKKIIDNSVIENLITESTLPENDEDAEITPAAGIASGKHDR